MVRFAVGSDKTSWRPGENRFAARLNELSATFQKTAGATLLGQAVFPTICRTVINLLGCAPPNAISNLHLPASVVNTDARNENVATESVDVTEVRS